MEVKPRKSTSSQSLGELARLSTSGVGLVSENLPFFGDNNLNLDLDLSIIGRRFQQFTSSADVNSAKKSNKRPSVTIIKKATAESDDPSTTPSFSLKKKVKKTTKKSKIGKLQGSIAPDVSEEEGRKTGGSGTDFDMHYEDLNDIEPVELTLKKSITNDDEFMEVVEKLQRSFTKRRMIPKGSQTAKMMKIKSKKLAEIKTILQEKESSASKPSSKPSASTKSSRPPKTLRGVWKKVERLGLGKTKTDGLYDFMERGASNSPFVIGGMAAIRSVYPNPRPKTGGGKAADSPGAQASKSKSLEERVKAWVELAEMEKLVVATVQNQNAKVLKKPKPKSKLSKVRQQEAPPPAPGPLPALIRDLVPKELELTTYIEGQQGGLLAYDGNRNYIQPRFLTTREIEARNYASSKAVAPSRNDAYLMEMTEYLAKVQAYFDQLGYHREGEPEIGVNIRLSIKHLIHTAKQLIKAGQPIKCLHALIMAVYFTNNVNVVERFPIHFKSQVNGREYKHVVLGLYLHGHFGALGISRDPGLQDKPTIYPRLTELIRDYHKCYNDSGHYLKEVKIGAIITHDPHSIQHITWKLARINCALNCLQIETEIERVARTLRSQMGTACLKYQHGLGCLKYQPKYVMQPGIYTNHTLENSRSKPTTRESKAPVTAPSQNTVRRARTLPASKSHVNN